MLLHYLETDSSLGRWDASKLSSLFVFYTIQHAHRILVLIEANTRWADTVAQQPLYLRGHPSRFLNGYHKVLILGLAIKSLREEQASCLSCFISCRVSPASMIRIPEKYQSTTYI